MLTLFNPRMRCMELFNGNLTSFVFDAHLKKMKSEVGALSPERMDQTDRNGWVDYFVSEYEVSCLVIYADHVDPAMEEISVQEHNPWPVRSPYEREYYEVPGIRVTYIVPYAGDPGLFELSPSRSYLRAYSVDSFSKPGSDGIGYFTISYEGSQKKAEGEAIKQYLKDELDSIIRQAECVNQDARAFNAKLRKQVEAAVDKRIQDLSKLATIRNILDIPLPRVEGGPPIKPIPLQKKQVRFDKPQQTSEESPRGISDCDYQNIIDIIDDCGALMERTPKSFAALDEEFLRDHILTILGTHYDNATGETFRKKGKTDICVPFEDHVAYIAECKIWDGKTKFLDAIEQLFSYTTWRDTKVSAVVFNQSVKNFEKVLSAIDAALSGRAIEVRVIKPGQWKCRVLNQNNERVMHVTVQVFDLYSPDAA